MILTTIQFKTSRESPWSNGYAIARDIGDVLVITNRQGEIVKDIWDYQIPRYPEVFVNHEYKELQ